MMRRSQTLGRYVVGLRPTVRHLSVLRPSVAVICVLGAACVFGSSPPSPLRGYRLVIEGRDSLSDYLAAALALSGQEAEAAAVLKRYLSLSGTRTRTINHWRAMSYSDHPTYLTFRERIHEGLRLAGMLVK